MFFHIYKCKQIYTKKYYRKVGSLSLIWHSSYIDVSVNGYRYVKWHVAGIDPAKYSTQQLAKFRTWVAEVLFIPQEYVLISGFEPASSVFITCMVPERYVNLLEKKLKQGDSFPNLTCLGIDYVEIGGVTIPLPGKLTTQW